jgi:hypothetical protein
MKQIIKKIVKTKLQKQYTLLTIAMFKYVLFMIYCITKNNNNKTNSEKQRSGALGLDNKSDCQRIIR